MCILACILDEPARCGLTADKLRAIAAAQGSVAALEQVAGRTNHKLDWMEGVDNWTKRDELALVVVDVGYARMRRPAEADNEAARQALARSILTPYLEALDHHEAELAEVQASLAEHLKPAAAPAPASTLPISGVRDMFTGDARMPAAAMADRDARPDQRRLF